MFFILFLIAVEVLSLIVLREHIRSRSRGILFIATIIHVIFSIWLWTILFKVTTYNSFFDNPDHIRLLMALAGCICAVVVPRFFMILFHYTGKLFSRGRAGHIRWMTTTGMALGLAFFLIIIYSTLYERFDFRNDKVEIKISGLNKDLDGLKIVQISDLHLSSFYGHSRALIRAMDMVNSLQPDLILNTGDFVSYGWREFDNCDTILSKAKSRYGNFAVMGNHDFGTYHPFFTAADRDNNVLLLNKFIRSSGYTVLNDTNTTVKIGSGKLGLIGIITKGRHPDMLHGNLQKAMAGIDTVDLKIFLSHDPNEWEEDVVSKTDIDITLSGHTHGMQMGIYTKWLKWSPSKYFYPHWAGLFIEGKQYQYVNRGLGALAIPFRIWMPPEITLITLKRE